MILLDNIIHTISTYSNRWGGPRYKTKSLFQFMNQHLSNKQNKDIDTGEKVNTILISEAFLDSNHTPLYLKSLQCHTKDVITYFIKDELGFEAEFAIGTKILVWNNSKPEYIEIENIQMGMERVVNLEFNKDLNARFNQHYLFISSDQTQEVLCEGINSNILLKKINDTTVKKQTELNKQKNIQELCLIKIEEVRSIDVTIGFEPEFLPFSYMLKKDKTVNTTKYSSKINELRKKKYLDKMRRNVYNIRKDKYKVKLEMVNEKNSH